MNSNQLAVAIITGSISPTKIPLSNGYPSAINKSVLLSLEKLQSLISRLTTVADHFLENDQISKQALKSFVALLKIVFKYLENYERLDLAIVKKIRQSLHDFLVPKSQIFGAELYLIFKAKKLLALIDSAIDRSMNISDAKTSLLKYIQDLDLVLLPKRIFISSKTPMVELTQTFLWQFDDKTKVSSLKEHIIECEVAVKNVQDQPIESLTVEAELKASECLFDQIKFVKKSIKEAKSLVSFQYLVHLESICKHKLEFSVRLVSSAGFLLDRIETKEFVEVV
jgi:hypothetical protein